MSGGKGIDMEKTFWYKDAVIYQIWPRSFKDADGDGVGDLMGVYEKLDYLKSLHVDAIWFSPLYPSPNADFGYDVADYMDISAEYGGMAAFKKVLDGAHERGIKVIMDLVVNHTSDEHPWFQASRRGEEPYKDYYIWRKPKKDGTLPNNWDSMFEGKAWQYDEVRKAYYLHIFAIKQPDLNMDNPRVRAEVKKILRFWLDMGVDGFREDVITYIAKADGLPSAKVKLPAATGMQYYTNLPKVHDYLAEFKRDVLDFYDCFTVGEGPRMEPEVALSYVREGKDKVLDMMINFAHMEADCFITDFLQRPFDLVKLKKAFTKWQTKMYGKGWNALYMENHDHPRVISRYGSEQYRVESGKMLAVSYLFLKGTPFVYQGQEIGMTNWYPDKTSLYEDVQTRNQHPDWPEEKRLALYHRASRDSARTPVQWTGGENAGFTTGTPWFYVNENYPEINVEQALADPDSILNFYKKAIALRKRLPVVRDGSYQVYERNSDALYVYARETKEQKLLVVCSFTDRPVRFCPPYPFSLDDMKLLLCNYPDAGSGASFVTRPYEARVYLYE